MIKKSSVEKSAVGIFSIAYAVFYGAGLLTIVFPGGTFQILQIAAAAVVAVVSIIGLIILGVTLRMVAGAVFLMVLFSLSCVPLLQNGISHETTKWATLFSLLCLSLAAGSFLGKSQYKELFVRVLTSFTLVVAIAVAIVGWGSIGQGRLAQGVGNPIWVGRAAGLSLIYIVHKYFLHRAGRVDMIYAAVAAGIIVLTGSRGPALAVLAASFVFVVFAVDLRRIVAIAGKLLVLFILLWIVVLISPDQMVGRFVDAISNPEGGTASIRADLYRIAIELLFKRPLGWGAGGFAVQSGMPPSLAYPHNLFLEAAVEWGLPFAIVFGSYILISLRLGWVIARENAKRNPILIFFVGLTVYSFINAMVSGDITSPKELYLMASLFVFGISPVRQRMALVDGEH